MYEGALKFLVRDEQPLLHLILPAASEGTFLQTTYTLAKLRNLLSYLTNSRSAEYQSAPRNLRKERTFRLLRNSKICSWAKVGFLYYEAARSLYIRSSLVACSSCFCSWIWSQKWGLLDFIFL